MITQNNPSFRVFSLAEIKKLAESVQNMAKQKNVTLTPMFIRENNIELEEDEIAVSDKVSEILFAKKEMSKETMTLDTGCPPNLVSESWLKNYLKEKDMKKEDLKRTQCNQKFRFGPSNIYISTEKVMLPIKMKQSDGEFLKIDMEVYVVNADNIPLLC